MVASGASLNWYRQQFGLLEQQVGALLGDDVYDLLTRQAAQVAPGSDGVIFLPYMMGERSPLWNTNARGVFFGLSLATPRGAVIRAIMEGAAFGLLHNVDIARKAGAQVQEVRSVGGGARSALWNQIKADVLGLPIKVPSASVGAPFGDAILAGMGLGLHPDILETLHRTVHINMSLRASVAASHVIPGALRSCSGIFTCICEAILTTPLRYWRSIVQDQEQTLPVDREKMCGHAG